jgi:hypothetical protein
LATKYIFKWEGDKTQPLDQGFTWKGKKVILPSRTAFGGARVIAEVGDRQAYYDSIVLRDEAIRRNTARISNRTLGGAIGEDAVASTLISLNGDLLEDVPEVQSYSGNFALTFNWYVDGTLRFTKDVYASDIPFRVSARDANGKALRGRTFEIEITGNVTVQRIDVASAMEELKVIQQAAGG